MNFTKELIEAGYKDSEVFEYVSFVLNHQIDGSQRGEHHHVLPVSLFPQFAKERINLIKLSYLDHFISHYLLAKFTKHRSMLFAFNQMKRVKNKGVELQDLCHLYEEFRVQLMKNISEMNSGRPVSKERREASSRENKGKVVYKNLTSGEHRRFTREELENLGSDWVFQGTGRVRTEESKKALANKYDGRKAYHDDEGKVYWFEVGQEIPPNLKEGLGEAASLMAKEVGKKNGSKSYYKNPLTGEQVRLEPGQEPPEGFVPGRCNFGEKGNPFSGKIPLTNIITKEKMLLKEGEETPRFFCNVQTKGIFVFRDKGLMAGISSKFEEKFNINAAQVKRLLESGAIEFYPKDQLPEPEFFSDLIWIN